MKITYFVHSTTTDNENGLATGWLQGELSEQGIEQSHKLRQMLKGKEFDAIYSSDLHRAIQSAEIFFDSSIARFTDERLRECNYGDLDGTPADSFKKNQEQNFILTPYPGGECYKDVEQRIRLFLNDLSKTNLSNVAIVAHQAPQLALNVIIKGLSWEQAIAQDWRKTNKWQPGWEYEIGS